jgi:hypothetical protein
MSPSASQYMASSAPRSQSARAGLLKANSKAEAARVTDGKVPENNFFCIFIEMLHWKRSLHESLMP